MTAAEWNAAHMPGTRVSVTTADGSIIWTRTASQAERVGQNDMLALEGRTGLWLLDWCRAMACASA